MPYYNQANPFWDFVASLDHSAANHPFFQAYNPEARSTGPPPPPPNQPEGSVPPQADGTEQTPSPHDHPFHHHRGAHHWGPRGRGGHRGSGRCGPPPHWSGFPNGGNFDLNKLIEAFSSYLDPANHNPRNKKDNNEQSFTPPIDIFTSPAAYTIHISLPGAKKEDVGVNWDADNSTLNIAGVVYRPGDEEFLKGLEMGERDVGVFERKVKLGGEKGKGEVDEEGIAARMEDGVLVVTVPKKGKEGEDEGWENVRKVDIE